MHGALMQAMTQSHNEYYSNADIIRLKNCEAMRGFCFPPMENSMTAQREWRGSMILFLKLQVNMNLQLPENSSVNALSRSCTSFVVLSASSMMMTLCLAVDESDTVEAKFFAVFLTVSRKRPSSDPLMT